MPHQKTTSPTQAASGLIRPDETLRVRTTAPTIPTMEATRMYIRLPWSDRVASGRRLLDSRNSTRSHTTALATRSQRAAGGAAVKGCTGATLPAAVALPLVAAEITLVLAPAFDPTVPAPADEGVTAVPTPVPAHRVAPDREATVELVDRLQLEGQRPSGVRVEGDSALARQNVPVLAAPEKKAAD